MLCQHLARADLDIHSQKVIGERRREKGRQNLHSYVIKI